MCRHQDHLLLQLLSVKLSLKDAFVIKNVKRKQQVKAQLESRSPNPLARRTEKGHCSER